MSLELAENILVDDDIGTGIGLAQAPFGGIGDLVSAIESQPAIELDMQLDIGRPARLAGAKRVDPVDQRVGQDKMLDTPPRLLVEFLIHKLWQRTFADLPD